MCLHCIGACNMLKLVRNLNRGKKKFIILAFLYPVKWDHYVELHKDQKVIGLGSGNKLSKRQLDCGKHKMKVFYAFQLSSRAVSVSKQKLPNKQ